MDPNDRLIEELGVELRRSLAEVRLSSELRQELRGRLLATRVPWWRHWSPRIPDGSGARASLAGLAAAAVALAVLIPLATSPRPQPNRTQQTLVVIPPSAGSAHSAVLAPSLCLAAATTITVSPSRVTLAPGQTAQFNVLEVGPPCVPSVTVTGPSTAALSVKVMAPGPGSPSPTLQSTSYLITWEGRSGHGGSSSPTNSTGTSPLAPGSYRLTVSIPHTTVRASLEITIRK
jgi:hypothetical protein